MADFEMETVDGVRYRPEDVEAAKKRLAAKQEVEKAAKPANKSRTASNKAAGSDKE